MPMKPIENKLKYCLVFTTALDEKPSIHGYANEAERDQMFEAFQQTGRITINDENLGVNQTIEPVYVARFDMIDGVVNDLKVKRELDGLG
ncbi:hypothetical protein [Terrihalobacillus insolitus]|uniref:hypothetical protein n=1 Tax=Terrihalobacillus insolitus TaxID=2950438 RepID=UPI002341CF50|nr:hypothetical protein [Terrihalobacillus insolitus]MDC3413930.1 hypothetical protein [Terrihalobacillus insolitus]